jgi:hypothetical protein
MQEDVIDFFDDAFKKISDEKKVNYNAHHYYKGRKANKFEVYDNIGSLTTLVRAFSGEQRVKGYRGEVRFSKMIPAGEIISLNLMTQTPPAKEEAVATLFTKIEGGNYVNDVKTVKERIDEALMLQKVARNLVTKNSEGIKSYYALDLPMRKYGRETLEVGGQDINLTFDKKEELKLLISKGNKVKAATNPENLNELTPLLDFQIGKLESLVS